MVILVSHLKFTKRGNLPNRVDIFCSQNYYIGIVKCDIAAKLALSFVHIFITTLSNAIMQSSITIFAPGVFCSFSAYLSFLSISS